MPAPTRIDRVQFLSRLAQAEQMVADGSWGVHFLDAVAALSDMAIGPMESELDRDLELRRRWDRVWAQSDVEYGS